MVNQNPPGDEHPKRHNLSKEERIAREKEMLLSQLAAERITTTRARVAWILNHFPDARNSDKVLTLTYWRKFQPQILGEDRRIDEDKMLRLENPNTITRARQKIQNEYGLFQASEEVQAFRRERQAEIQEETVLDKPDRPLVAIYADESGKNDGYALVGSVWTLDAHRQTQLWVRLVQWKADRGLKGEFHFNGLSRGAAEHARGFVIEALAMADTLSFKAVAVRQKGMTRPVDQITMELYYQLVMNGLQHEFATGRLSKPRELEMWKDKEQGIDALHLERMRQDLRVGLRRQYGDEATLQLLAAVDSKANHLIQLADLFTGSLNRVLNSPGENPNHKDEFAHFMLGALGLKVDPDGNVAASNQDVATLIMIPS